MVPYSYQAWANWALSLSLLSAGCGNDYPLPPTPCDDFCHATERVACEGADPAGCVSSCEQAGGPPDAPECAMSWESFIACMLEQPDPLVCRDETYTLCAPERASLLSCACGFAGPGPCVTGERSPGDDE